MSSFRARRKNTAVERTPDYGRENATRLIDRPIVTGGRLNARP